MKMENKRRRKWSANKGKINTLNDGSARILCFQKLPSKIFNKKNNEC
jgi:hypothetical protein